MITDFKYRIHERHEDDLLKHKIFDQELSRENEKMNMYRK